MFCFDRPCSRDITRRLVDAVLLGIKVGENANTPSLLAPQWRAVRRCWWLGDVRPVITLRIRIATTR
jgi:hypothetical protein